MKRLIRTAVFLLVFGTALVTDADIVNRYIQATPSATDIAFPKSPGAWPRLRKALGFENKRIYQAKKSGKITPVQAKELFKKVTAGFRQINACLAENHRGTWLTVAQDNQITDLTLTARRANDAVLGPADPPFEASPAPRK